MMSNQKSNLFLVYVSFISKIIFFSFSFLLLSFIANVNNIRSNTKGMSINFEKLADTVIAMEERQDESSKSTELIHTLVSILLLIFILFFSKYTLFPSILFYVIIAWRKSYLFHCISFFSLFNDIWSFPPTLTSLIYYPTLTIFFFFLYLSSVRSYSNFRWRVMVLILTNSFHLSRSRILSLSILRMMGCFYGKRRLCAKEFTLFVTPQP